jgi:hypothetical protein
VELIETLRPVAEDSRAASITAAVMTVSSIGTGEGASPRAASRTFP